MEKNFKIVCRETGDVIDWFPSFNVAKKMLQVYDKKDKEDGTFEPDFYEIKRCLYAIEARTNVWIASRDKMFNGKTSVILCSDMTLQDAQKGLLRLHNVHFEKSFPNWGLARCNNSASTHSYADGTRSFEFDSRVFSIVQI